MSSIANDKDIESEPLSLSLKDLITQTDKYGNPIKYEVIYY